jgi:hypothetical protein
VKRTNDNDIPIFLIGEGRSGTTIIFEALTQHYDVAFFSNYTDTFFLPQISIIHKVFNKYGKKTQYGKRTLIDRIIPTPEETYRTWERLVGRGFRESFMREVLPSNKDKQRVRRYIKNVKRYQNKSRFVAKLTGPPRINFLSKIYPEAYFIDIVRDPRAVVASLLNVQFRIEKGFNKPSWKGTFEDKHFEIWNEFNRTEVALLSLEWLAIFEQTIIELKKCKNKYIQIKYEDFTENFSKVMEKILRFADLDEEKYNSKKDKEVEYKNMK